MPLLRRVLAVACAAFAALVPVAPAASAATLTGNDYSWPQCPSGVGDGQGQPLPAATRTFAIVGLTNGQGLHENPCLASMWSYARSHAADVTGYTMVTYPTRAQVTTAMAGGHYGRCATLTCALRNHGWAQGAFTAQSLAKLGAHPPLVWIDVEPRSHEQWSHNRANNSLVVRAVVASLQAHGFTVGIYSNRYLWNSIAGYRTSLPEWVPGESLSRACGWSFAGGRVLMSQWSHTYASGLTYDENGRCAGAPAMATWWQPSHPTVTSLRNSTNGGLLARFGTGRTFGLGATSSHPAALAVAASPAGTVPLFVATTSTGALRARTLATPWRAIGAARCVSAPAAAVTGRVLSVHCTDASGAAVITTVPLDAYGGPLPANSVTAPATGTAPAAVTSAVLR